VSQTPVRWAVLAPASWISPLAAAGIEAAGTFVQLLAVFMLLANRRYHQWAPVAAGVMLTGFIIALASLSGAAFSPVRALGPDVLAGEYPMLWIYFAGPAVGSAAAAAAVWFSGQRPVTGKLFHDPTIECHMRCAFPDPVETPPSADEASALLPDAEKAIIPNDCGLLPPRTAGSVGRAHRTIVPHVAHCASSPHPHNPHPGRFRPALRRDVCHRLLGFWRGRGCPTGAGGVR
jgi:hypothetical protein